MTAPTECRCNRRDHEHNPECPAYCAEDYETPGLTTEQARAFAAKWAEYRDYLWAPLSATEREQLFAWVRAWMADSAWHPGEELEASCRDTLAGILEISRDDVDALLVSAGWPS